MMRRARVNWSKVREIATARRRRAAERQADRNDRAIVQRAALARLAAKQRRGQAYAAAVDAHAAHREQQRHE